MEYLRRCIEDSIECKRSILHDHRLLEKIKSAGDIVGKALKKNGKIILCGNGGSAADAQHLSAEFISKFEIQRSPLAAIALTTDSSALTAISNDFGFEQVFSRQLEALGNEDDVLIAITTSGKSCNILRCCEKAQSLGIRSIGLTGRNNFRLKDSVLDIEINVPSANTARIQEAHIMIGHAIVGIAERVS